MISGWYSITSTRKRVLNYDLEFDADNIFIISDHWGYVSELKRVSGRKRESKHRSLIFLNEKVKNKVQWN
jgi:hypothetical protein